MATVTKWFYNKGPYSLTHGATGGTYAAKSLVKKTMDEASAEYIWLSALVTAGKFARYADDSGCPCDETTGDRIVQAPLLTVEQYSANLKGLVEKYQALLNEYSLLYAAADTAELELKDFSKPTAYNLTYFPVAENPA